MKVIRKGSNEIRALEEKVEMLDRHRKDMIHKILKLEIQVNSLLAEKRGKVARPALGVKMEKIVENSIFDFLVRCCTPTANYHIKISELNVDFCNWDGRFMETRGGAQRHDKPHLSDQTFGKLYRRAYNRWNPDGVPAVRTGKGIMTAVAHLPGLIIHAGARLEADKDKK